MSEKLNCVYKRRISTKDDTKDSLILMKSPTSVTTNFANAYSCLIDSYFIASQKYECMFLKVFKNVKSFKNNLKQQLRLIHGVCLEILYTVLVSYTSFRSRWITAKIKLCASSSKCSFLPLIHAVYTCVEDLISIVLCALKSLHPENARVFANRQTYHKGTEGKQVDNNTKLFLFMLTLPSAAIPYLPIINRVFFPASCASPDTPA